MSLFSAPRIPDAPKEDPAIAAARLRAQNQADNSLTMSIQDDLRRKMQARLQRFGLVPAANSVRAAAGPSTPYRGQFPIT